MLWVNAAVRPAFAWPNQAVELPFEGRRVVLQPRTDALSSTASVFDESGTSFEEGGSLLRRFLSLLAWSHDAALIESFCSGSNDPRGPGRLGNGSPGYLGAGSCPPWRFVYLPDVTDPKARLGLALYREALGLRFSSVPFAFLSFFKVLNTVHQTGADQKAWINANLQRVTRWQAEKRLTELRSAQSDLGKYLYGQGRNATAHAHSQSANPDDYADGRRLEADLPLMQELSALFIESELGVERESTFSARTRDSNEEPPQLLMLGRVVSGRAVYVPFSWDNLPP